MPEGWNSASKQDETLSSATLSTMVPAMSDQMDIFLKPVMRGKRFDEHCIPVDVLIELANYRELIAEVARTLYFQDHQNRKRVPRNWEDNFQLCLTEVEPGSAIPVLKRFTSAMLMVGSLLFSEPSNDYFDKARDLVNEVISLAQDDKGHPSFPIDSYAQFSAFGKTLKDDESIELIAPGKSNGPKYDKAIRKKLLHRVGTSYEDQFDIKAKVIEGSIEKDTVIIKTSDDSLLSLDLAANSKFRTLLVQSFADTFVSQSPAKNLHITGVGIYDTSDKLEKVLSLTDVTDDEDGVSISAAVSEEINLRLDTLARLKDDWNGPDSPTFDIEGLKWAGGLLYELLRETELKSPYLYPAPDGDVRAEWPLENSQELCIIFALDTRNITIIKLDHARDSFSEAVLETGEDQQKRLQDNIGQLLARV